MEYPSSINFINKKEGISVSYCRTKFTKYNLDVWAISHLLNEGRFSNSSPNMIELDLRDTTMALRSYFLPKLIKNVKFAPCVEGRARSIMECIKNERYITYPNNYEFPIRGTKKTKESRLENNICKNMVQYFEEEFSNNIDKKHGKRQFPANIFDGEIKNNCRISRKFWIDMLMVNKRNQLSVIELKAGGNAPLDLFIQAIDYGIYCHLFKKHISEYPFINNKEIVENKVAVYLIAEKFHPALIGNETYKGLTSLILKNDILDIVLLKIKEESNRIERKPEIIFDTRKL